MKSISLKVFIKESSISVCLPRKTCSPRLTKNGMVKSMIKLLKEVIETERATLPFNIVVTKFEAVPPGADASKMMPTLYNGSIGKNQHRMNATIGSMINCANNPVIMALG